MVYKQKSVSITEEQEMFVIKNCINLSRLTQQAIKKVMKGGKNKNEKNNI